MISISPLPAALCVCEGAANLDEVVQRIIADNATLKHGVLQLEAGNRMRAQNLAAARENARFTDHRIADLEVQHVASADPTRRAGAETQ